MRSAWNYDNRRKWRDKKGDRWHFAEYWTWNSEAEFWFLDRTGERSYHLYFRDDARTVFGVIKFSRTRDISYGFDKLREKIMNDAQFRQPLVAPNTKRVWKKSWK
jgi:hypothetical protein